MVNGNDTKDNAERIITGKTWQEELVKLVSSYAKGGGIAVCADREEGTAFVKRVFGAEYSVSFPDKQPLVLSTLCIICLGREQTENGLLLARGRSVPTISILSTPNSTMLSHLSSKNMEMCERIRGVVITGDIFVERAECLAELLSACVFAVEYLIVTDDKREFNRLKTQLAEQLYCYRGRANKGYDSLMIDISRKRVELDDGESVERLAAANCQGDVGVISLSLLQGIATCCSGITNAFGTDSEVIRQSRGGLFKLDKRQEQRYISSREHYTRLICSLVPNKAQLIEIGGTYQRFLQNKLGRSEAHKRVSASIIDGVDLCLSLNERLNLLING